MGAVQFLMLFLGYGLQKLRNFVPAIVLMFGLYTYHPATFLLCYLAHLRPEGIWNSAVTVYC
jgi:hypothetical protein